MSSEKMEPSGDQQESESLLDSSLAGGENGAPEESSAPVAPAAADKEKLRKKIHPSGKTVIVKNLPASMLLTYADDLKTLLGKYGEISYIKRGGISIDYDTVNPTLTAYVNFDTAEAAEKAMAEHGNEFGGNILDVEVLRAGVHTVVVSNLPSIMSNACLASLLGPCGAIKEIVKIPARPTAFVEFEEEEGLNKALSLNGTMLINNEEVTIMVRGGDQTKSEKSKGKGPMGNKSRGSLKRGGSWGGGRGGRPQGNFGGWESYRSGRGGYGGPPGNFGNNWGNGNFRDSNNDNDRMFKRRKQNDWIWQY